MIIGQEKYILSNYMWNKSQFEIFKILDIKKYLDVVKIDNMISNYHKIRGIIFYQLNAIKQVGDVILQTDLWILSTFRIVVKLNVYYKKHGFFIIRSMINEIKLYYVIDW